MPSSLPRIAAVVLLLGSGAAAAEDLKDVYNQALASDPQLRAAEAGHMAALETRPQSRAPLLPNVNFSANTQWNDVDLKKLSSGAPDVSKKYNSSGYTLSLRQALYHHDYYVQLRQADASIAQADAQYDSAKQGLIVRVADAYFNLLAAQNQLEFAQAEKRAIEQQLKQTQQRFEVGLSAITDVHEAQAGYDGAVAQEIVAQNQLDNAREVLREITGAEAANPAPLADDIPLVNPDPTSIDKWVDTALQQNPGVVAAEAATDLAREEVNRREAGHYPSLDIVASHNWSDTTKLPLTGAEASSNVVGLQLNVPLYAGGGVSSQVRQASYLYNQAQDALDQTRRATVRSTRDAYLGVTAGISTVQARKQALASAQTALEATQAGYDVGTRTAVDVLNAQQVLFGAQRDYARARYDYALASLRLKQAAGILTEGDLEQINGWLKP